MPDSEAVIRHPSVGALSGPAAERANGTVAPPADVFLYGRPIRVHLSRAARAAAARLCAPLVVEMELYFSCLVRKAVRFRAGGSAPDPAASESARLADQLVLQFRPVTTPHCKLPAGAAAPPLEAMPVARPQAFVPRWLAIDFHHGEWVGEFGY